MSKELFPHPDTFGYRLEYKDGKNMKVCWFCHSSHLQTYLDRYKPTSPKIDTHPNWEPFTQEKKETPKKRTVKKQKKKQKQQLFADVDTYVTVKAPSKAPRRRSKTPQAFNVGKRTSDRSNLLQDKCRTVKDNK